MLPHSRVPGRRVVGGSARQDPVEWVATVTATVAANAAHLARVLRDAGYPPA